MNGLTRFGRLIRRKHPMCGPYKKEEIPRIPIDYKGLVKYAEVKGCAVEELTDTEKTLFIKGFDMEYVRSHAIKV